MASNLVLGHLDRPLQLGHRPVGGEPPIVAPLRPLANLDGDARLAEDSLLLRHVDAPVLAPRLGEHGPLGLPAERHRDVAGQAKPCQLGQEQPCQAQPWQLEQAPA